jgi:proprotein convertase subtilisin/kexin type 5
MVGFYEKTNPPASCVINCTFNIPGCRRDDCTSNENCTVCKNGFYLNPVGSNFNCLPCSANCLFCTISGCNTCATGYVITSSGLCDLCSNLLKHCATCNVYSACTQCENSQTTLLLSNQQCKTCSELESNCISCQRTPDLSDLLCNQCV